MEANKHSLPTRELTLILTSIVSVCLLAWLYLFDMAASMADMEITDMSSMDSMSMQAMNAAVWDVKYFIMMFLMWAIMMIGMMLPSATPAILIFAAISRKAKSDGYPVAQTWVFILGYLLMWTAFSLLATLLQWGLDNASLLSPMMAANNTIFAAMLLIAAGLYQWLPIKNACLKHCRTPVHFIAEHWQAGSLGALVLGMKHGLVCLGCCWVLMGLLFFGGVMNLIWIAGIAIFVLLEKILPMGDIGGRLTGVIMCLAGILILI